jgi:predicted dehydrogenase
LILDMAIHTFDAARAISAADPVSVYCHSFNPGRSWYKGDASAVAIFEMTGGIVFTYRGSWCAQGLQTPWESQWRVLGQRGTLTWDGNETLRAQVAKTDGKPDYFSETADVPVAVSPLPYTSHEALIRDFVDCVRTGRRPETDCHDNIKSLAMVLAAVRSAHAGRRVTVMGQALPQVGKVQANRP